MIRSISIALLLALAGPARADPVEDASAAALALQEAGETLSAAEGSRDRVAALTTVVRAYEAGLAAFREAVRGAVLRERELREDLKAFEAQHGTLIGALLSMGTSPEALSILHPSGPVDSARAAMLMSQLSPALAEEAARLRTRLEEMRDLRTLQRNATDTLERGLAGARQARQDLSQAISDRDDPPDAAATDLAAMEALINSADTLQGFAASLVGENDADTERSDFWSRQGDLSPPVTGTILRRFGEAGPDGVKHPGLSVATHARMLVTAPHAATVRYAGPLLDLGQVTILELAPGALLVLAGLSDVYGQQGDILAEGTPVGIMGGTIPAADQILIESSAGKGQDQNQTLYIELRTGTTPVDPAEWFDLDQIQDGMK